MSTLSLRKIKHDSSAVDNITLNSSGHVTTAERLIVNGATTNTNSNWGYYINPKSGGGVGDFTVTRPDGNVSWLSIDGSGRVTMPYQPAFRVYNNATLTPTNGTTAIFNTVLFDRGSNYNTSTGRFTAPVAGVYAFFSTARPKTTLSPHEYEFRKNGSRDILQEHISSGSGATMTHQTVSMITYMNVNDYVVVHAVNNMQWDGGSYNGFSGFLVS